jgi:uncharacterized membrane protein YgcG
MRPWKLKGAAFLAAVVVSSASARPAPLAQGGLSPTYLDQLLAPVALYPDQLLAQILMCSGNSTKVVELGAWLKKNAQLKGSELQEAAQGAGFEPSFVALAPFPQVVELMAGNPRWTSQLGGAFAVDRGAVFDSIQRLRAQSKAAGNLKSTPQQTVETKTTQSGEQVIVIEPANPQVIYVPQYNPTVVYTQPAATTTTVIVQDDDDDEEAAVAGALVGFAAGVAIGAAFDNHYYYGPHGWYGGGAYMYNDAWDDWYDNREDMREDFYENREDARENYQDRREDLSENRTDRANEAREQRSERTGTRQEQRTERTEARGSSEAQAQRQQKVSEAKASGAQPRTSEQRSADRASRQTERSGTRSDAFSNYSSGKSTRQSSSRGSSSRGSRSSGGGGRRR